MISSVLYILTKRFLKKSEIPRSKLRGISPSRQSPNVCKPPFGSLLAGIAIVKPSGLRRRHLKEPAPLKQGAFYVDKLSGFGNGI